MVRDNYRNRRLMLLRHGQSGCAHRDHDRCLSAHGREQVVHAAQFIKTHALIPDLILCSTAQRTVETCRILCTIIGFSNLRLNSHDLYLASYDQVLGEVQSIPEEYRAVLIVGHNCGLEQLACAIAPELFASHGLRPAELAVFELCSSDWLEFRVDAAVHTHLFHWDGLAVDTVAPRDMGMSC